LNLSKKFLFRVLITASPVGGFFFSTVFPFDRRRDPFLPPAVPLAVASPSGADSPSPRAAASAASLLSFAAAGVPWRDGRFRGGVPAASLLFLSAFLRAAIFTLASPLSLRWASTTSLPRSHTSVYDAAASSPEHSQVTSSKMKMSLSSLVIVVASMAAKILIRSSRASASTSDPK
jgi:hypothetical protein